MNAFASLPRGWRQRPIQSARLCETSRGHECKGSPHIWTPAAAAQLEIDEVEEEQPKYARSGMSSLHHVLALRKTTPPRTWPDGPQAEQA
mmetsp:Transcript_36695/g.67287  ORF Transcript_36695/g.67287 Transcript_36695/m.67287 type:complete len:90 (-) Transcript_36695:3-272(-)